MGLLTRVGSRVAWTHGWVPIGTWSSWSHLRVSCARWSLLLQLLLWVVQLLLWVVRLLLLLGGKSWSGLSLSLPWVSRVRTWLLVQLLGLLVLRISCHSCFPSLGGSCTPLLGERMAVCQ